VIKNIQTIINNNNNAEQARVSNVKFEDDFIQYAHMKNAIK
jgi:hypothetical protein